jgi:5'-nucleotidase
MLAVKSEVSASPVSLDTCRSGSFAGAQYRYLAANVIDQATGKPLLPGYAVKKYALSGAQIEAILEQQLAHVKSNLQVSQGFSYEWNAAAPIGKRIEIGGIKLDGVAIAASASYRVTVNEFLAEGGDGFALFAEGTDRIRGVTDVQALEHYLAENSPIAPPMLDRVKRLN